MTVQTQTPARHAMRLALILAAAAALIFSLAVTTRPVLAGDNAATLHEPHRGVDSSEDAGDFPCESDEPDPGEVIWHFVLNGLDPGIESALEIHAQFDEDGDVHEDSSWNPGGTTHQFFVTTSGDDILLDAWVFLPEGTQYNNLVLSHICRGDEPEESEAPPESEEASRSPEGSQLGGTGTPAASVPDTALGLVSSGPLATIFFGAVLIASLGALAYANVAAVRRRS
ncbi:MAG TPA: hypothetical protein VGA91_04010 [Candidatus Limnocylindria bacterium]